MTAEVWRSASGPWRGRLAFWYERLLRLGRRSPRRLRLCETLPLGDRRFVAVVEFEGARFLLGGTATTLVLLSRLEHGASREQPEVDFPLAGESAGNERFPQSC